MTDLSEGSSSSDLLIRGERGASALAYTARAALPPGDAHLATPAG